MAPLLSVISELVAKSDGKDKLLATIQPFRAALQSGNSIRELIVQYILMLLSGGNPGTAKDIQVKVAAARKVFRIMKPLETIAPVLREPYLRGHNSLALELLPKLKNIFMASYFGFDHLVWLGSVAIIKDKALLERFQKASTGSWLLGSLTTIVHESIVMLGGSLDIQRRPDDKEEEWQRRQEAFKAELRKRILVLTHAVAQALLATGLLQLWAFKPRTTATFGVIASAMNCYMLAPAVQEYVKSWAAFTHRPVLKLA